MKIKNIIGHLRNILIHKFWVCYFGRKLGMSWWRCIMHDVSKLSPIEFFESVKYYQGTSSPINAAKADKGYSLAWQHHKGHNPHHYEHWTDNYDSGTTVIPMPFEYMEEMIADWCAAGRTYQGKDWSFESQCEWWKKKNQDNLSIHIETKRRLTLFFSNTGLSTFNWWKTNRQHIKTAYNYDISNPF